ncbi:MAG: HDOD domain-containing protein [Geobacteraceae bacterium]|nr:HDOD domain-containing protein [Geobacteraceae bacterium]
MTGSVVKKSSIQKLLTSQHIDIPVFHEVALRLLQMMNAHSYRIEDAIILVHQDTALASEMLRYANSTYNSGKSPITTIKNAIVRLGSQQVVNLAFTASMASSKSDNPLINTHLKKLWHHCHAVAISSSCLAVQIKHDNNLVDIDPDEVYLAGLFHDIGKLYLLKSMDKLINDGRLQADSGIINDIIEELSIQQGVKVMQHWNIPEIYINSIGRQITNNWKCGTNDQLVAAVRLSCKIHKCIENGIGITETSEVFYSVKEELSLLHIDDVDSVYTMIKAVAD